MDFFFHFFLPFRCKIESIDDVEVDDVGIELKIDR